MRQKRFALRYKGFDVAVSERKPGRWQALVRRADGADVRVGSKRQSAYRTKDAIAGDLAFELARLAIDAGEVQ